MASHMFSNNDIIYIYITILEHKPSRLRPPTRSLLHPRSLPLSPLHRPNWSYPVPRRAGPVARCLDSDHAEDLGRLARDPADQLRGLLSHLRPHHRRHGTEPPTRSPQRARDGGQVASAHGGAHWLLELVLFWGKDPKSTSPRAPSTSSEGVWTLLAPTPNTFSEVTWNPRDQKTSDASTQRFRSPILLVLFA